MPFTFMGVADLILNDHGRNHHLPTYCGFSGLTSLTGISDTQLTAAPMGVQMNIRSLETKKMEK